VKNQLLILAALWGCALLPLRANLLTDGDFSTLPGSGTGTAVTTLADGNFKYVPAGGTTSNVGGTGGWTFQNITDAPNSAIYIIDTQKAYSENWIPPAAAANTNGYTVQLDTISTSQTWTTGNAIYQTVAVTSGDAYALTFSINTESGNGKGQISDGDVMVTNATITNSTGSSGTILTGSSTNHNALNYGDVTGYQYAVNTSGAPNTGGTALTWATYTLDFTATSNSIQIALADDPTSTGNSNSNISLENINLVAVPEPREWSLLVLLAIGGLVAVQKVTNRFRSQPVSA